MSADSFDDFPYETDTHASDAEARRHYCWYLKGVKYANYYKDQINHMETLEDLYRVTAGIKRDLSD